jgi:hypothetical protein
MLIIPFETEKILLNHISLFMGSSISNLRITALKTDTLNYYY